MDGPLPAALALVLVVSVAAFAPVGSGPAAATATATPVTGQPNSTAYLTLPADELRATRYDRVTLDTAGAVALEHGDIQARYLTVRVSAAFQNASTEEERREALNESAARVEDRIDELHRRERAALAALNSGQITTDTYLREVAAIHAEASALRNTVRTVIRYNRVAGQPLEPSRMAEMKVRLLPLYGPVREHIADAMRDEATDQVRVYVETSTTGVVLGTVNRDEVSTEFVREAYWGGGFDPTGTMVTNDSMALEQFRTSYPWINDDENGDPNGRMNYGLLTSPPGYATAGIFGMRASHLHGTNRQYNLISYIDGHTGEVFREIQYQDVTALPTQRIADNASRGLRMRIDAAHPSGPMRVNVTDGGQPVDAAVYVNGQTVARTGSDGELWTVAPRTGFNVTVAVEGTSVTATPRANR